MIGIENGHRLYKDHPIVCLLPKKRCYHTESNVPEQLLKEEDLILKKGGEASFVCVCILVWVLARAE